MFAILLPSDVLSHLRGLGSQVWEACVCEDSSLADFWHRQQLAGEDAPEDVSVIHMFYHEDGVPSFRDTSHGFWSWTSLSTRGASLSRQAILGMPSSRVLPSTRAELAKVIAGDMTTLATGLRPTHDHLGNAFDANSGEHVLLDNLRGRGLDFKAGKEICQQLSQLMAWMF